MLGEHPADRFPRIFFPAELRNIAPRSVVFKAAFIAAAAFFTAAHHGHMAEFARDAVFAGKKPAVDLDDVADPRAEVTADADAFFRKLGRKAVVAVDHVDVAVQKRGKAKRLFQHVGQRHARKLRDIRSREHPSLFTVHARGHPHGARRDIFARKLVAAHIIRQKRTQLFGRVAALKHLFLRKFFKVLRHAVRADRADTDIGPANVHADICLLLRHGPTSSSAAATCVCIRRHAA